MGTGPRGGGWADRALGVGWSRGGARGGVRGALALPSNHRAWPVLPWHLWQLVTRARALAPLVFQAGEGPEALGHPSSMRARLGVPQERPLCLWL